MHTTPTELSVESIESVLVEKEAALAKEQAMLEDLRGLLGRMGYELVPAGSTQGRRGGKKRPASLRIESAVPERRKPGRPRKVTAPDGVSSETAAK